LNYSQWYQNSSEKVYTYEIVTKFNIQTWLSNESFLLISNPFIKTHKQAGML